MNGVESLPISFDKLVSTAQRYRLWVHVLLYPLGWATLYASSQVPPLDALYQWVVSGTSKLDSLGMEWVVLLQLAIARIHPLDETYINEWIVWILFLSFLFLLPQVLFWTFYTKRKKLFWGILVFITVNLFSLYMHRIYCVWSFNQVSTLNVSLPAEDLLKQYAGPLYYTKGCHSHEPCWIGIYSDGYNSKVVHFTDDGTAHVIGATALWMD